MLIVSYKNTMRGAKPAKAMPLIIIDEVAAKHGLSPSDITSKSREREKVIARREAIMRMHHECVDTQGNRRSGAWISRWIGHSDPTTANKVLRKAGLR